MARGVKDKLPLILDAALVSFVYAMCMKQSIFTVAVCSFLVACAPANSSSSSQNQSSDPQLSIEEKWLACLGNPSSSDYSGVTTIVPNDLILNGVDEVLEVYSNVTDVLVGVAFEATVEGNGGDFTFRLGILNDLFGAFVTVSESEHPNFGDRVFNALRNGLSGMIATYDNVLEVYVEQGLNTNTAGVTETLQQLMPAIEAMIVHYDQIKL